MRSEMLFQTSHHGKRHILAPVACHHLHADGQARASLFDRASRALDIVLARDAVAFFACTDTCRRDNTSWHPQKIVEPRITVKVRQVGRAAVQNGWRCGRWADDGVEAARIQRRQESSAVRLPTIRMMLESRDCPDIWRKFANVRRRKLGSEPPCSSPAICGTGLSPRRARMKGVTPPAVTIPKSKRTACATSGGCHSSTSAPRWRSASAASRTARRSAGDAPK